MDIDTYSRALGRRGFLVATAAALAMLKSEALAEDNVKEWPTYEDGMILSADWKKECNPVTQCFNDNNGVCWYVYSKCVSCHKNSFPGYIIADARCAYIKRDSSGNVTDKLCVKDSSVCASRCRLCY